MLGLRFLVGKICCMRWEQGLLGQHCGAGHFFLVLSHICMFCTSWLGLPAGRKYSICPFVCSFVQKAFTETTVHGSIPCIGLRQVNPTPFLPPRPLDSMRWNYFKTHDNATYQDRIEGRAGGFRRPLLQSVLDQQQQRLLEAC